MPRAVDIDPLPAARSRARALGLTPGRYAPGAFNAITDVAGVRVGHLSLVSDSGAHAVRSGVTAILPSADNAYEQRLQAGSFVLNGAGELLGITQVTEWGLIETPILLTGTLALSDVGAAVSRILIAQNRELGITTDVVIPVVGECDDSWLHDARGGHVREEHVRVALENAQSGPVTEGSVGAGTGMITCDFAGGIGTASRRVPYPHATYTLGALVLSNFGAREDLIMDGLPLGRMLRDYRGDDARRTVFGSIVVVLATDAPLLSAQLNRLCKRAALGISRVGSSAAHGSGEIVLAFSTQNRVPRARKSPLMEISCLYDAELNPLFQAAVEVCEEAILNALCMGSDRDGVHGHFCPALPLYLVSALVARRAQLDSSALIGS